MQIKSSISYYNILITVAKRIKTSTSDEKMEELELSHIVSRNVKSTIIWKKGLVVSNINHTPALKVINSTATYLPRDMKTSALPTAPPTKKTLIAKILEMSESINRKLLYKLAHS